MLSEGLETSKRAEKSLEVSKPLIEVSKDLVRPVSYAILDCNKSWFSYERYSCISSLALEYLSRSFKYSSALKEV